MAALVLSLLLISWVVLGVALMGRGPSPDTFPIPLTLLVPLILFVLVAVASILAWLTHHSGVSWLKLRLVTTFVAGLVAVVVVTAAVSAPVAYGLDGFWNACCWNPAASRLFRGWLDGEHDRNLLRFVFLDDAARALIPNWEERARRLLAESRADYSRTFRDARASELVDHLMSNSALFSEAWDDQAVEYRVGGLRSFFAADGHVIHYVQHTYLPLERPDYKLVVLVPDSST